MLRWSALALALVGCIPPTDALEFCTVEVDPPEVVSTLPFDEDDQAKVHTVQPAPDGGGLILVEADVVRDWIYAIRYEADGSIRFAERIGQAYKLGGPNPVASLGPSGWAVTWTTEHDDSHPLILVDDTDGSSVEVGRTPSLGAGASLTWTGEHFLLLTTSSSSGFITKASTWTQDLQPLTGPRETEGYNPVVIRRSLMGPDGPALDLGGAWLFIDEMGDERQLFAPGDSDWVDMVRTEDGWAAAWTSRRMFYEQSVFARSEYTGDAMSLSVLNDRLEPVVETPPLSIARSHTDLRTVATSQDGTALLFTTDEDELGAVRIGRTRNDRPWRDFDHGEVGCRSLTTGSGRILEAHRDGDNLTALILGAGQLWWWETELVAED